MNKIPSLESTHDTLQWLPPRGSGPTIQILQLIRRVMTDSTTLIEAVRKGDLPTVTKLLSVDPALAQSRNEAGVSAILLALYHGHERLAKVLGQRVPWLDIFEAAALGEVERVQLFLSSDPALADARTADGFDALGLAVHFGQEAAAALLVRWSDPNRASDNALQVTALHAAVACRVRDKALPLARMLLAHGASPNLRQQGGWTPLHGAAAGGHTALVKLLLESGADPSIPDDEGLIAADRARKSGHDSLADAIPIVSS